MWEGPQPACAQRCRAGTAPGRVQERKLRTAMPCGEGAGGSASTGRGRRCHGEGWREGSAGRGPRCRGGRALATRIYERGLRTARVPGAMPRPWGKGAGHDLRAWGTDGMRGMVPGQLGERGVRKHGPTYDVRTTIGGSAQPCRTDAGIYEGRAQTTMP